MQDSFDFDFADRPEPLAADLLRAAWVQALLADLGLPEASVATDPVEPALLAVKPEFRHDRPWPLFGSIQ